MTLGPRLRTLGLVLGWLGAGLLVLYPTMWFDLEHNIFNWQWSGVTDGDQTGAATYAVGLGCIAVLARTGRHPWGTHVGLVVCAGLLVLGLAWLPSETLSEGVKGRYVASPGWYRWGRLVALGLPLGLFVLGRRRLRGSERTTTDR